LTFVAARFGFRGEEGCDHDDDDDVVVVTFALYLQHTEERRAFVGEV